MSGLGILGVSGSLRVGSTNTALLTALAGQAPAGMVMTLTDAPRRLPPFSPDEEGPPAPAPVETWAAEVASADALVIACPEYVHALPGAFKNAIDWLVARDEIIAKPIALIHGSHRGADVLADLDRVLATVSSGFAPDLTLRLPVLSKTPAEVSAHCVLPENRRRIAVFFDRLAGRVRAGAGPRY